MIQASRASCNFMVQHAKPEPESLENTDCPMEKPASGLHSIYAGFGWRHYSYIVFFLLFFCRPCDAPTDVRRGSAKVGEGKAPWRFYRNLPRVPKKIERFKNGRSAAAERKTAVKKWKPRPSKRNMSSQQLRRVGTPPPLQSLTTSSSSASVCWGGWRMHR